LSRRKKWSRKQLQFMVVEALTQENTRGENNSPKSPPELLKELDIKKSSLYYALHPLIRGDGETGATVGCELYLAKNGRIKHRFKVIEPKALLIPAENLPFAYMVDKKNRRTGAVPFKPIRRGLRRKKGQSEYYARRTGPVIWPD